MITAVLRHSFPTSILAAMSLVVSTAEAQQPSPAHPAKKDLITITLGESGWSANGSLVMGVRIHAPMNEDLKLFHGTLEQGEKLAPTYTPFSLVESYLLDGYTGKKIAALPALPADLSCGPMETASYVRRGGWMQLCVAFPAPPPPPPKDGKPQPYKLLLYTPLDASPVVVVPPAKQ